MSAHVLKRYQKNKAGLSNSQAQIARAEAFLADQFQIRLREPNSNQFEDVRRVAGDEVADRYEEVNALRAWGSPKEKLEGDRAFYDLISEQPMLGLLHSEKWPYILDAGLYLSALVEHCGVHRPFVDFGCHAGYHALWLAQEHGLAGLGLDSSEGAIREGERMGAALGLEDRVRFRQTQSFALNKGERVGLIFSIDGPAQPDRSWLARFAKHLDHDGLLVMIGGWDLSGRTLKRNLKHVGLDLLLADVVGGWDGSSFGANMALVFARGRGAQAWRDLKAETDSIWYEGFAPYCNTPGRPPSDKILAKFRAHLTAGPPTK